MTCQKAVQKYFLLTFDFSISKGANKWFRKVIEVIEIPCDVFVIGEAVCILTCKLPGPFQPGSIPELGKIRNRVKRRTFQFLIQ